MNPRPDFCPGCGAQVYPEEASCPFCGRKLHTSFMMPFLVGLGGTAVAIASGGLVWWVMSAPPAEPEAGAPQSSVVQSAVVAPAPQAQPAPQASVPPPAAPAQTAPAAPPQAGSGQGAGGTQEAALPLPTVTGPITPPAADATARRAFAKSKQESFAQNGLDLTVTAGGEDATILTIKFNFPAKTAAELIVSGPFPRQCEQRGFRQVLFVDPSGITWVYDVATQQMTQK